jgi:hypothetical protein
MAVSMASETATLFVIPELIPEGDGICTEGRGHIPARDPRARQRLGTGAAPGLRAPCPTQPAQEATLSTDVAIETVAREDLARVLDSDVKPADLDPDLNMAGEYGLTSLNKVLFLMSVCDDTGVSLSSFTEPDVAGMQTLRDVVTALAKHAGTVA